MVGGGQVLLSPAGDQHREVGPHPPCSTPAEALVEFVDDRRISVSRLTHLHSPMRENPGVVSRKRGGWVMRRRRGVARCHGGEVATGHARGRWVRPRTPSRRAAARDRRQLDQQYVTEKRNWWRCSAGYRAIGVGPTSPVRPARYTSSSEAVPNLTGRLRASWSCRATRRTRTGTRAPGVSTPPRCAYYRPAVWSTSDQRD